MEILPKWMEKLVNKKQWWNHDRIFKTYFEIHEICKNMKSDDYGVITNI